MTLSELLARTHASLGEALSADRGDDAALAAPVTSIAYDSTRAAPGAVFVGLRGERVDGSTFAGDAERAGAVCIVSESATDQGTRLPWVQVRDARRALAALSVEFFEHPSHHLPVIAVTGTNGKTTTAYLIQSIFESAGVRCGRIGTIGHQIGSSHQPASLTTPEASDIQSMLRAMVDGGAGACVMEAS